MAKLIKRDGFIYLSLSAWEQVGALHAPVKMPETELLSVEYVENPWNSKVMRGMRAPGTGVPYLIMLGTLRNLRGWKAFCAIYKRKPAIVISWKSGPFNQWIVTAPKEELALFESDADTKSN